MIYLESPETNPYFNLALEQHVFDSFDSARDYFMLWQNYNAIIIGKHQNAVQEINADYVRKQGISVARRLSGGGAVYHDMGNLNFTFIADSGSAARFDFSTFCRPVVRTLQKLGIPAELNGRNDMTIEGKKFSGNAMYIKRGRIMHHGTIMYNSDLDKVGRALSVSRDKIASKGLASVRSRVTNVIDYLPEKLSLAEFKKRLLAEMFAEQSLTPYAFTEQDLEAARVLQRQIYETWEWNFGASPQYDMQRSRRVEGVGKIDIHLNVREGKITGLRFQGDYFGDEDDTPLIQALLGQKLRREDIAKALSGIDIGIYFAHLSLEQFLDIIADA